MNKYVVPKIFQPGPVTISFINEREEDEPGSFTVTMSHNGVDMTLYDGDNSWIAIDTYDDAIRFFEAQPEEVPNGY
jgi:hypothetical protein